MLKNRQGIILFILIAVPIFAYVLTRQACSHEFDWLKKVTKEEKQSDGSIKDIPYNVYEAYPNLSFKTQTGATLTWDQLRGKTVIADVFFTRCKGICPKLSATMAGLHDRYFDDPEMRFLSISVDPENDSIEALRQYANQYGANADRWYFVTGDKEEIFKFANQVLYFSGKIDDSGNIQMVHDETLRLIDKDGFMRFNGNFIDGTKPKDVERLHDELKLLRLEYEQGKE